MTAQACRPARTYRAGSWRGRVASGGPLRRLLALVVLMLFLRAVTAAGAGFELEGAWQPVSADAAGVPALDAARARDFDPAALTRFAAPDGLAWVALRPAAGAWPSEPWVLEIQSPGLLRYALHIPGEAAPRRARLGEHGSGTWPGHDRIAFPIDADLSAEALLLQVDSRGVINTALRIRALPVPVFQQIDARWLALASACLGIMVAMAVMALVFAVHLRELIFLTYALYICSYGGILALQSGFVLEPLGWVAIGAQPQLWGRVVTAAATAAAAVFLVQFANLRSYVPLARRLLIGYAILIASIALAGLVPALQQAGRTLINPLLVFGGVLLFGAAVMAARRGSRHAWFFLAGWTPLLLVTVLGSLHVNGLDFGVLGSSSASLVAGAFEALVLSVGLADRTLGLRREHAQARRLAELDDLTGLYNRRGFHQRLEALAQRTRAGAPLAMLFMDLDGFKHLNDRHGHEAGDQVLRLLTAVLREQLREGDLAARYGGEEFVVALPGAGSDEALAIAERIRLRLEQRSGAEMAVGAVTVSIGVASLRADESMATLLRRADGAMYAAKSGGRNQVVAAAAPA